MSALVRLRLKRIKLADAGIRASRLSRCSFANLLLAFNVAQIESNCSLERKTKLKPFQRFLFYVTLVWLLKTSLC